LFALIYPHLLWNYIMQFKNSEHVISVHSFSFHLSVSLWLFVGLWPLLQFCSLFYTDGRTPWTSDQPVTRPLLTHRATQTQRKRTHNHPYFEWDLNPWYQRSSERRQFMPYTARPLWSACNIRVERINLCRSVLLHFRSSSTMNGISRHQARHSRPWIQQQVKLLQKYKKGTRWVLWQSCNTDG
jgi:hypothetical protein